MEPGREHKREKVSVLACVHVCGERGVSKKKEREREQEKERDSKRGR